MEAFAAVFAALEDPRTGNAKRHLLLEILLIALCTLLSGGETCADMALFGRAKQGFLGRFLRLEHGVPSHDTFSRVFRLLDPAQFRACFVAFMRRFAETCQGVVAVDGKTLRRSFEQAADASPLHLVSAWACEQRLVLGQLAVDGKSNEITAVPELLDTLHLDGCIVTLDAMGCQKSIERIRARGANYLLVLKANHGRAFKAVQQHFEHTCFGRGSGGRPVFDAFDERHGRLVRRRVFVSPAAKDLEPLRGWPDLCTVLAVETIRSVNGTGKTEAEIRYFLTSCDDDPAVLVRAIRRHWGHAIERTQIHPNG